MIGDLTYIISRFEWSLRRGYNYFKKMCNSVFGMMTAAAPRVLYIIKESRWPDVVAVYDVMFVCSFYSEQCTPDVTIADISIL